MTRPAKGGKRATGSETLLKIIEAITSFKDDEFTTNDLVRKTGIAYSTAYKYLSILQRHEWVEGWLDLNVHKVRGVLRWRRLMGGLVLTKPKFVKQIPKKRVRKR